MLNIKVSEFTKTKLVFTLWYSLILLIILISFSAFIFTLENQDVTRVVLQRDYGTHLPKTLTEAEEKQILLQIQDLRYSLVLNLILVDDLILLFGGILSYFLAEITLKPIQKSVIRQKEFMADASHELRTPLAAIQLASEVALRKNIKTKKDYKKVIEQTYRESSRMSKMVDELLTLSRADMETARPKDARFSLKSLTQEIIKEAKPLVLQKGVSLKNTAVEETLIKGDRNRIKQLILIILDNAIKFTPKKGNIYVRVGRRPKPFISISDTGIGIPKHEQGKIFYRFYQADKSRSESGAGLGLSIAKRIADTHKATISVKSTPRKGSTFKIIFNR